MTLQIRLPYPPKILWPNGRGHRMAKARKAKAYKHDCGWLLNSRRSALKACTTRVVTWTCHPMPSGPAPDEDNFAAALKYAIDALAEAWGINDRELTHRYQFGERVKAGAVVLEIKE